MLESINKENDDQKLEIRLIHWSVYNFESPILLQDKNGPCPLISLINTLILSNEINKVKEIPQELASDAVMDRRAESVEEFKRILLSKQRSNGSIEVGTLISELGELLLVYVSLNPAEQVYDIDSILKMLPLLYDGLPANPDLISGTFPSNDVTSSVFHIFDLEFIHGWYWDSSALSRDDFGRMKDLVDIADASFDEFDCLMRELRTFDGIQDFLLQEQKAEDEGKNTDWKKKALEAWLQITQTQLTSSGITKINENLGNDSFAVLFRNNHFSTVFKKDHLEIYLLLTDISFGATLGKLKQIVWQSFTSISGGDDLFFTGDFSPVLGEDFQSVSDENSGDYELSKKLQEEDDAKLARRIQESMNLKDSQSKQPPTGSRNDDKGHKANERSMLKKKGGLRLFFKKKSSEK